MPTDAPGQAAIAIRRAAAGDVLVLVQLYAQLDDVHAAAEPLLIPPASMAPRSADEIRAHVEDDRAPMFVAVDNANDAQVIGFARVVVRELGPTWIVPRLPDLEELVVLEGERGRGVGSRLMQAVENWAVSEGFPELWIAAWSFNEPAAGLYRQRGFVPLSTRYHKRLSSPRSA